MLTYFSTADPVASLLGVIRSVFVRPTAFFRQMPAATSYRDSIMLLLIVLVAPLMLGVLLSGDFAPHISVPLLLVTLPVALASSWLWAGYLSWAVRRFSHGELSTKDAFQLYAYSNVPSLFGWIPGINIITGLWSLYLQWKGLTAHAGVSGGWAWMILILPLIVLIISALVLVMLVGFYLAQQPAQPNPVMMF